MAAQVRGPVPELPDLGVSAGPVDDRPQRTVGQRPLAQLCEQGRRPVLFPLGALVAARSGEEEVDHDVRAGPGGPGAHPCGPAVVREDTEVRPLQQRREGEPADVVAEVVGDVGGDGGEQGRGACVGASGPSP